MSLSLRTAALLFASLCAACGSVHHTLRADLPPPASLAVLPFGGTADAAVRDTARSLVHSRLQAHGFAVAESAWVDRMLSERGWLADPAHIAPDQLPLAAIAKALGVDAIVVGDDLHESRFNMLLIRRHAFGGALAIHAAGGEAWWTAEHGASDLGGLLLQSGQVLRELGAQGTHGTPLATLALVDRFVEEIVDTVPRAAAAERSAADPVLTGVVSTRAANADGSVRVLVEARASPGSTVRFDLLPQRIAVPMVEVPGQPGTFRGAQDLAAGDVVTSLVVHARGAFGREAATEVKS